jgi:tetratricopeptide (TPR) repeat protein
MKSGNRIASRQAVLEAYEAEPGIRRAAEAGTILARSGWIEDAQQIFKSIPADSPSPLSDIVRLRLRGEILLASGHISESVSLLERAKSLDKEPGFLHDYWLHALIAAGQWKRAERALDFFQKHSGQVWHHADIYLPGWTADLDFEIALAKLKDRSDLAQAQSIFQQYLSLRQNADSDINDVKQARQLAAQYFHSSAPKEGK